MNLTQNPTVSVLTDRFKIIICYRGKSNGENYRIGVENAQSLVIGMIKQFVIKQVKKGGGGGVVSGYRQNSILDSGEIIIVMILFSYLSYLVFFGDYYFSFSLIEV